MGTPNVSNTTGKSFDQQRLKRISELEQWHFWFAGRQTLVADLLRPHLKANPRRLMDLGCGTGFLLRKYGGVPEVIGVDLLRDGLISTRKAMPSAMLLQAEAAHIPLKNETLDGVIMLDVLEHVDDNAVLKEAARVLKPKGWLLISVPAIQWLWSYRDKAAGHMRRYNRRSLTRILASAKFQVEKMRYFQFFLFPLVAISRFFGRHNSITRDLEETHISFLNGLLASINRLEAKMSTWISWPVGSSIVLICRKIG